MPSAGRPRALDEVKQREICALVAAGCTLREAARYVRCGHTTILREARRNDAFRKLLDEAAIARDLKPLRALEQAVGKHWRAAAWMLERSRPERYGRRDPRVFRPRQARKLLHRLLEIIATEVHDPLASERIQQQIREAMDDAVPGTSVRRPGNRELRRAMRFFDAKDSRKQVDAEPADPANRAEFPKHELHPADQSFDAAGPSGLSDALRTVSNGIRDGIANRNRPPGEMPSKPPVKPLRRPSDPPPEPPKDPFIDRLRRPK